MLRKFRAISTIIASVKYTFYHFVTCCALPGDSRVFDQSEALCSPGIASVIVMVMLRISDYRCEATKRKDSWAYNFAIFYSQHSDQRSFVLNGSVHAKLVFLSFRTNVKFFAYRAPGIHAPSGKNIIESKNFSAIRCKRMRIRPLPCPRNRTRADLGEGYIHFNFIRFWRILPREFQVFLTIALT